MIMNDCFYEETKKIKNEVSKCCLLCIGDPRPEPQKDKLCNKIKGRTREWTAIWDYAQVDHVESKCISLRDAEWPDWLKHDS